jgi:hypothetical protein
MVTLVLPKNRECHVEVHYTNGERVELNCEGFQEDDDFIHLYYKDEYDIKNKLIYHWTKIPLINVCSITVKYEESYKKNDD